MIFLRHLMLVLALAVGFTAGPILPLAQAVIPPVTNFGKVTVSGGYTSAATSIVLLSGHGTKLPATGFPYPLSWWDCTTYGAPEDDPFVEIVSVTARTTDTLTVIRAHESTTAQNHNTGGKTYCMVLALTKGIVDAIRADIAAAAGGAAFVHTGSGSPEGVVTAPVGHIYLRTDTWSGVNVVYQKVSGTGNTGWVSQPDLASPGPIGLTAAGSGSFTTLSSIALTSTLLNLVEVTLTYGATVSVNADAATIHKLTVTNGTGFTIANPSNPSTGRLLILRIRNTSGGVMATPTFDTLYKLPDFSVTKPGNGFQRFVAFVYDGTNWNEIFCSPAVPN